MGGTDAMRVKGTVYLPQEMAESTTAYQIRLKRSFLFNGYAKAVDDFTGRVFAKDITLEADMPQQIQDYCDNIDLAGQNIDVFARAVFKDGLTDGISYILIDMDPPPLGVVTVADARALNRRPWAVHIKAAQVLGWRSASINGKQTLTQFRYRDDQVEYGDDFVETQVAQIRVLTRTDAGVTWETWRKNQGTASGEWELYGEGIISMMEIPVVPVYINRTGFFAGMPPLSGLAEVNLAHWQSSSDQRNILHVARVPILFAKGWADSKDPVEIGASRLLMQTNDNADLKYVEHSGAAIGSGRDDIKDLEQQMQVLGLELMIPTKGSQSATGATIDQAKMTAPLAMMAKALEDAMENALQFMA